MKQVSIGFKNQIKELGREIDSIITYYNHYKFITEDNQYILTEDGQKILTEQINRDNVVEITAEDIYNEKLITHGDILSTMMKEFDFEVKQEMQIGSIVNVKFGVKVDDEYEYIDYGDFIVNQKEYKEDTKTYSYKAYDSMLLTMTPFKAPSSIPSNYTIYDLFDYICSYCHLTNGVEEFANSEREFNNIQSLEDLGYTNRDILDFISEISGSSIACNNYILETLTPNDTNLTLQSDSFKDSNVNFNKVYGPINSILFSRGDDTDVIEIKDDESIATNGVTQIKIKDNPFLEDNDRSDYQEELFDVLNGLTYTLNDLDSIGITYLDYYDKYKVQIGENTYDCLLLNDEISINQGLEEKIFTEEYEGTTQEYKTSRLSDKDQKWANIQVKKDLGEITLEVGQLSNEVDTKVGSNEIISKINMSPEQIAIQTQKLNLTGYITASDLSGSGTTTINGANITTGTISADRISGGTLSGTTISGNSIIGGTITANSNFSEQNPYINVVSSDSTEQVPIETRIWGDGISVWDYSYNPSANIRTEINGRYAELYNGSVNAFEFNNVSLEEKKKNFEKLENALDIVKETDIYKYNYIADDDKEKKHIGIVIGDKYNYAKEITSNDNKGVDTYSMISVLWQAVKEQQEEIEKLKERIDNK